MWKQEGEKAQMSSVEEASWSQAKPHSPTVSKEWRVEQDEQGICQSVRNCDRLSDCIWCDLESTGNRKKHAVPNISYEYFYKVSAKTNSKPHFILKSEQCGIFGAGADTDIREQENSDIWYICWYYVYKILFESGDQILVTKICIEGRISHILTNFPPNITALYSKYFTDQSVCLHDVRDNPFIVLVWLSPDF